MARTIKKQPKSDRPKKVKRENTKKTSFKRSDIYDYSEDENELV